MCAFSLTFAQKYAKINGKPVHASLRRQPTTIFWESPRRVFTRDQLLSMVWGADFIGETRTVDVHIATLCLIGENAPIFGIRQLLSSIVYNLCDNAIKYNRKNGSVTVTVQNKQDHVLLTVADTGIGIPTAEQERIFERFYRVDKSHSKALGGTGLGLSIVKHAAKIHNATIDLQSTPDRGTEITIHFPKS
jgi:signal transduction histidine kinase